MRIKMWGKLKAVCLMLVMMSIMATVVSSYIGYDCTALRQQEAYYPCPLYAGPSECVSSYWRYFYERWGCEGVEYESNCTHEIMPRYLRGNCIFIPYYNLCMPGEDYNTYYMRACA